MSPADRRGISSVSPTIAELTPDELRFYRFVLSRRAEANAGHELFCYDPLIHAVFVPEGTPDARFISSFLHELGHAALGSSLLALATEALSALESLAALVVVNFTAPILGEGLDESVLEQIDRTRDQRHAARAAAIKHYESHLPELAKLRSDKKFLEAAELLALLNRRRVALLRNWRLSQEGIATFIEIDAMEHDAETNFAAVVPKRVPESEREQLFQQVLRRTRKLKERLENGDESIGSDYREGYELFRRVRSISDHPAAPLHIARIASHVAYWCCSIVDASDREFKNYIDSTLWGADRRLKALLARADWIMRAVSSADGTADVLGALIKGMNTTPLSEDAVFFARWERDFVWQAPRIREFFGNLGDHFWIHEQYDTDQRRRVGGTTVGEEPPVVIHADGRIAAPSREIAAVVIRQLIAAWRTEMTVKMLPMFLPADRLTLV